MIPQRILNFHGIGVANRPVDPAERPYWISEQLFSDIIRETAEESRNGRVAITFDDGNKSDIAVALPIMATAGLRGTFFVLAGRLGAPGFLSPEDVSTLEASGMNIGSHGFDHLDWRHLDAAQRHREFIESRIELQKLCVRPVAEVAIPFGSYDRSVLGHLLSAGYSTVYTSDGGPAGRGQVLARTSIRNDMTLETVRALIDGREAVTRRLYRSLSRLRKRLR